MEYLSWKIGYSPKDFSLRYVFMLGEKKEKVMDSSFKTPILKICFSKILFSEHLGFF